MFAPAACDPKELTQPGNETGGRGCIHVLARVRPGWMDSYKSPNANALYTKHAKAAKPDHPSGYFSALFASFM